MKVDEIFDAAAARLESEAHEFAACETREEVNQRLELCRPGPSRRHLEMLVLEADAWRTEARLIRVRATQPRKRHSDRRAPER